MKFGFKQVPREERIRQHAELARLYPGKIPVVVEKQSRSQVPDLQKSKYLVSPEMSVAQFMYLIRKKIHLQPDQALFIHVNNHIPSSSSLFSTLYKEHRDDDGFLYVVYAKESSLG